MKNAKWTLAGVAMLIAICGAGGVASGQGPATDLPVDQTTTYKGEEFLLIGDANRGAGEPVIAVNPKNPNDIVVGAMCNLHYVEGEPLGVGEERVSVEARVKYRNTPGASISRYAISHDRGRTWTFMDDPWRDYFKMNGTADAFTGFGADGTIFIGSMNFFPMNATPEMLELEKEPLPGLLFGATDMAWSKDGGKTWSTPSHVMGQYNKRPDYGPDTKPEFIGKTPYDRPFLATDQSTGTLYVPGNGTGGEPSHMEAFVRASKDNGKSWGPIYAYDSEELPQGGFTGRPVAANGVLAVAYVASSAPRSALGKCPCVVFGASRDEGKTFDRHVVKYDFAPPSFFDGMGNPSVAADASHPGRFAVMSSTAGNSEIQMFVTDDYGKTWKGPVHAGGTPGTTIARPDMVYSPRGELALMWLAKYPDQTYSAWSAVSHNGGSTFSAPLQVSHSRSPARGSIKNRGNNWDGDDLSSIAADSDYVHLVWADGRAGFLGAWYARIPISSY